MKKAEQIINETNHRFLVNVHPSMWTGADVARMVGHVEAGLRARRALWPEARATWDTLREYVRSRRPYLARQVRGTAYPTI